MAEGLKLVNEIYTKAKEQLDAESIAYFGIAATVHILSDLQNADLLERLIAYCKEPVEERHA